MACHEESIKAQYLVFKYFNCFLQYPDCLIELLWLFRTLLRKRKYEKACGMLLSFREEKITEHSVITFTLGRGDPLESSKLLVPYFKKICIRSQGQKSAIASS